MIARDQSTKTEPAPEEAAVVTDPGLDAEASEAPPEPVLAAETVGETPAEYVWSCIQRNLRARFESPSVQSYLAALPIFGGETSPWRLILTSRGEDADPSRRRFLLRRALKDIEGDAQRASAATVVLRLLLWFELDAAFWRFLRLVPRYETLGPDLLHSLEVAVEQLPHRLEHAAERGETDVDLGKELVDLTLYLTQQLVDEHRKDQASPRPFEVPSHEASDARTRECLGRGQIIAGLFSPTELTRILDEEHLFRVRVAGSTINGRALLRVVRYPILQGH